jgi:hypothetical protein
MSEFDLAALGAAVGDELAGELLGPRTYPPCQITLERADLASVLAAAAATGAARFVQSAETRAAVEGDDGDLAACLETVRTALSLICQPEGSKPQAERAADSTRAVHILGQLVNRWGRR